MGLGASSREVPHHLPILDSQGRPGFPFLVHPAPSQHTQILGAEGGGGLHSAVERRKEGRRSHTWAPAGSSARSWLPHLDWLLTAHYTSEAGAVTTFYRCGKGGSERLRTCQGHTAPLVAGLIGPQLCLIPETEVLLQAVKRFLVPNFLVFLIARVFPFSLQFT